MGVPKYVEIADALFRTPRYGQVIRSLADEFGLSSAERNMLAVVGTGLSGKEMTDKTGYTIGGIYRKVSAINMKVGSSSKAELQALIIHRLLALESGSQLENGETEEAT